MSLRRERERERERERVNVFSGRIAFRLLNTDIHWYYSNNIITKSCRLLLHLYEKAWMLCPGLGVAYSRIYGPNLSSTFLQSKIENFPLKLESGRYLLNFTCESDLTKLTKQVYFNKKTAKKDVIKVILLEFNKTISNNYSKITGKMRRHLGISHFAASRPEDSQHRLKRV